MKKFDFKSVLHKNLFILFIATAFCFFSCSHFLNGNNIKNQIQEEIFWANISDPLKIDFMSPGFQSSGVPVDSVLELNFNKSILPSSFVYSLRDSEGTDLSCYYSEPAFYSDNKVVKISPNTDNPLRLSTGDVKDIVFTLSKDISDSGKIRLAREDVVYNIRLNSKTDELPPILRSMKVTKKRAQDSEEKELSTIDYEKWTEETCRQNHVNSVYLDCEARDTGNGAAYLKVKETVIYDSYGNAVTEKSEKIVDADFKKSKEDSTIYNGKVLYNFESAEDGLVKLDVTVLDYNLNESVETFSLYVIKDTSFGTAIGSIYTPALYSSSPVTINLEDFNTDIGFYNYRYLCFDTEDGKSEPDTWYFFKGKSLSTLQNDFFMMVEAGPDLTNLKVVPVNSKKSDFGFLYLDTEDSIENRFLKLTILDDAGNVKTSHVYVPGKPVLRHVDSWGTECYDFITDKVRSPLCPDGYTTYYNVYYAKKGSTELEDNKFNCLTVEDRSLDFRNRDVKFTTLSDYVFRIQEVWIYSSYPKIVSGSSSLSDLYDGAELLDVEDNGTPADFDLSMKILDSGSNQLEYTVTLNKEGLTEEQISHCYVVYDYINFEDNGNDWNFDYGSSQNIVFFNEKDGEYKATVVVPTQFDSGYNYAFAVVPLGDYYLGGSMTFSTRNAKAIVMNEVYDNVAPVISAEISHIQKQIVVTAYDTGDGLAENTDGEISIEVYYKKNGFIPDDLSEGNLLTLYFPKNAGNRYVIPLHYFDASRYYFRFRVCDKNGNSSVTENIYKNFEKINFPFDVSSKYTNGGFSMVTLSTSEPASNTMYSTFIDYFDGEWKKGRSDYVIKEDVKAASSHLKWDKNDINDYIQIPLDNSFTYNTSCRDFLSDGIGKFIRVYLFDLNYSWKISEPRYFYIGTTTPAVKVKDILSKTVLCDQPTLVNVIYSNHDLGNDPFAWEKMGTIARTRVIENNQTIDDSEVPEDMYYALVVHFADNTTLMSDVKIK